MTAPKIRRLTIAAAMLAIALVPVSAPVAATTIPSSPLLFGLGPTADSALASSLPDDAPVSLLTTWFNGTEDLEWLRHWRGTLVDETYAAGFAHHVIVYDGGEPTDVDTPYGRACGAAYALSDQFLDDMRELATVFAGSGPLYVTLFTEFQTYPCVHNQWAGSEAYYRTLQDQFFRAAEILRSTRPGTQVGLGWGGWQSRWDEPAVGGGRSLLPRFADVMRDADYQAFQAMEVDSNLGVITDMTRLLGAYGPVMVAHYLPDDESRAVVRRDLDRLFSDEVIAGLINDGLFAFAFMDDIAFDDPDVRQSVVAGIRRYGLPRPVQDTGAPSPQLVSRPSSGDDDCGHRR